MDEPLLPIDDLLAMLADVGCRVELDERGQPCLKGKTKKCPQELLRQLRLNREAIRKRVDVPKPPRQPPDDLAFVDDDGSFWLVEGKAIVHEDWVGVSLFELPGERKCSPCAKVS